MNNPLSYSSVKLDLFSRDGTRLKPASGFVVEAGNQYYLITNWHVLTGKDISSGEAKEPLIAPYMLKTTFYIYEWLGEMSMPLYAGWRKRFSLSLYDDNVAPRWIERRMNEGPPPIVDVVALHLPSDKIFTNLFRMTLEDRKMKYSRKISSISLATIDTDVEYAPPDTVHIIGYPQGWAPAGAEKSSSAFWRTSSIASELHEPGTNQAQSFFVDPCAPEGMTGSPVVGLKNDRIKLLGIYSDQSTAEFGANAGLVWDARLIKELIDSA